MSPALKAARIGAISAIVVLALAGAGGWLYESRTGALSRIDSLERVAVVFSAHGEDGAQLAQVVALVTVDGRRVAFVDPGTKVVIPGTSYDRLRDAYAFGGGGAVAAALEKQAGGRVAYVDVPEASWEAALSQAGAINVTLPRPMNVFDGTRLATFPEGALAVSPTDVPLLLQGTAYLRASQRRDVARRVGDASIAALARWKDAPTAATDLSPAAYARLLARLAGR